MNRLRLGLALVGFAAALLAVSLGDERVGWAAIALLVASLIVRLLQQRTAQKKDNAQSDRNDSV